MQTSGCLVNHGICGSQAGKKPTALPKDLEGSESEEEADVEIQIPEHKVKLIIGAGGDKIKHIQRKSKCRVQVSVWTCSYKALLHLRTCYSGSVGGMPLLLRHCHGDAFEVPSGLYSFEATLAIAFPATAFTSRAEANDQQADVVGLQQQGAVRPFDAGHTRWHAAEQSTGTYDLLCCC